MALTFQQARLVKGTIPALRDNGELIAATFYKNMLDQNPSLRSIFNLVNQQNGRQPRALTAVILSFANNINNISALVPMLERMGNRHCSLAIKPDQYKIVAHYLIRAFAQVLGPAWTPDIELAWTRAYWVLAKMMIAREAQLYAKFDSWVGWRKFRISGKTAQSDAVDAMVSFYLSPVDGSRLPGFFPGQYVSVQVRVPRLGHLQSRQYSLSEAPRNEGDYYRITVKRDEGGHCCATSDDEVGAAASRTSPGLVSNLLIDDTKEGDIIEVSHPAGEFFLDTNNGSSVPLVLISAGSGVTPLVSILNYVIESQPSRHVSWIQGVRRAVPFEEHVRQVKRSHPNVRTNIFKTELAEDDVAGITYDVNSRVSLAKISRDDLFLAHRGTLYFVCGPELFTKSVADYLHEEGVDSSRMSFELFSTGFWS